MTDQDLHIALPKLKDSQPPFTAVWHAYELGRIAFREGDKYISPFEARLFYGPLTDAWKRGWDAECERQAGLVTTVYNPQNYAL